MKEKKCSNCNCTSLCVLLSVRSRVWADTLNTRMPDFGVSPRTGSNTVPRIRKFIIRRKWRGNRCRVVGTVQVYK